jgi:putative hydrolases of HD superfamily
MPACDGRVQAGIATLTSHLTATPAAAAEIAALWEEYEAATTPEALLVKDLDKFEMIVQALEYEEGVCHTHTRKTRTHTSAQTDASTYAAAKTDRSHSPSSPTCAHAYTGRGGLAADGKQLDSFFRSTEGKFTHPQVQAWVAALYARRRSLQPPPPPPSSSSSA